MQHKYIHDYIAMRVGEEEAKGLCDQFTMRMRSVNWIDKARDYQLDECEFICFQAHLHLIRHYRDAGRKYKQKALCRELMSRYYPKGYQAFVFDDKLSLAIEAGGQMSGREVCDDVYFFGDLVTLMRLFFTIGYPHQLLLLAFSYLLEINDEEITAILADRDCPPDSGEMELLLVLFRLLKQEYLRVMQLNLLRELDRREASSVVEDIFEPLAGKLRLKVKDVLDPHDGFTRELMIHLMESAAGYTRMNYWTGKNLNLPDQRWKAIQKIRRVIVAEPVKGGRFDNPKQKLGEKENARIKAAKQEIKEDLARIGNES